MHKSQSQTRKVSTTVSQIIPNHSLSPPIHLREWRVYFVHSNYFTRCVHASLCSHTHRYMWIHEYITVHTLTVHYSFRWEAFSWAAAKQGVFFQWENIFVMVSSKQYCQSIIIILWCRFNTVGFVTTAGVTLINTKTEVGRWTGTCNVWVITMIPHSTCVNEKNWLAFVYCNLLQVLHFWCWVFAILVTLYLNTNNDSKQLPIQKQIKRFVCLFVGTCEHMFNGAFWLCPVIQVFEDRVAPFVLIGTYCVLLIFLCVFFSIHHYHVAYSKKPIL
jgi:hypothetical protein